jgi:acetyl esterase
VPSTQPTSRSVAATGVALRVGVKVVRRIPAWLKRLISGGRAFSVDGNTLDATAQLMLFAQRITGTGGLSAAGDVTAARVLMHNSHVAMNTFVPVAISDFEIPGPAGIVRARQYRPTATGAAPLLVFFHGGGFVVGDIESHDGLCRMICRHAVTQVLSVDYRLAPEHPAPAAIDDCFVAYRWAIEHAADLGADPSRLGVGGDSAGGALAALVALRSRDENIPQPALQVLLYPVLDLAAQTHSRSSLSEGFFLTRQDMEWFTHQYLGRSELAADDPRVSPLRAADLSGVAPTLILTAGFDPLRDEGAAYAKALRSAGVCVDHRQFDSLTHGFASIAPFGGGSAEALTVTISAIRAHLNRV